MKVYAMNFKVGDSVIVKPGVIDPDFENSIGAWQGRIEEIVDSETVFIRWDSITLIEMGIDIIIRCENEDFDWEVMYLKEDDIDIAIPRDTESDVANIAAELQSKIIDDPRLITEPDC